MVPKLPTKNVVSFFELRKRCPKDQIQHLEIFLAKRQKYQERLTTLKKNLPVIDWEYYKRNVRSESVAIVVELEKKYKNYSVPYPEDIYSKEIDDLKADLEVEIADYIKKSNERIAKYEEKISKIKSMLPYDQMTWEDYCNFYPEEAPDFLNRPTFWPHDKEEQIDNIVDNKEEGKDETEEYMNKSKN